MTGCSPCVVAVMDDAGPAYSHYGGQHVQLFLVQMVGEQYPG
jgi:hypothetical protein